MAKARALVLIAPVIFVVAGCQAAKSSNPLSPSVAGPIPGVAITAPKLLEPNGATISAPNQPVTLLIENASTTGQRPLSYLVEVAVDAGFTSKVLTREGVEPGEGGRTSLRLPDALASDRTYYWRARAQDGANTGPYADAARFSIVTPVVIDRPTPSSPINDTKVTTVQPRLVFGNAPRSGPAGNITYVIEVSDTEAFAFRFEWFVGEQAVQTSLDAPVALAQSTRYFWRVRAVDPSTQGPWSVTQLFRTPDPVVIIPPTPGPGPGPHVTPGPLTVEQAEKIVNATAKEFPQYLVVFRTDGEAEAAAEQLLLRTIWHLQLAGFQAGRQRNPSGAISKDKLTINIGGWRAFDIYSLGTAGTASRVQFLEVWPAGYLADSGIPD